MADDTVVKVAAAIKAVRDHQPPGVYRSPVLVVDEVATSIAEALFPNDALTENCTRRLFLTSAGANAKRLLAPRAVSQSLADRITHACGPQTGCSADTPFPPG